MSINSLAAQEYEPLNQPERIDKALQNLFDVSRQLEPVDISNKQEAQATIIVLNFILGAAYNEVVERGASQSDPLAEEDFQAALRTLKRYIQQHLKEPSLDIDADHTSDTDFTN